MVIGLGRDVLSPADGIVPKGEREKGGAGQPRRESESEREMAYFSLTTWCGVEKRQEKPWSLKADGLFSLTTWCGGEKRQEMRWI